jgi:hypothetical protein
MYIYKTTNHKTAIVGRKMMIFQLILGYYILERMYTIHIYTYIYAHTHTHLFEHHKLPRLEDTTAVHGDGGMNIKLYTYFYAKKHGVDPHPSRNWLCVYVYIYIYIHTYRYIHRYIYREKNEPWPKPGNTSNDISDKW